MTQLITFQGFFCYYYFETKSHVVQVGLQLSTRLKTDTRLLIFLSLLLDHWHCKCTPCLAHAVLGSNPGPPAYQALDLSTEPHPHSFPSLATNNSPEIQLHGAFAISVCYHLSYKCGPGAEAACPTRSFSFCLCSFETGTCYVAQASLQRILLLLTVSQGSQLQSRPPHHFRPLFVVPPPLFQQNLHGSCRAGANRGSPKSPSHHFCQQVLQDSR